MIKDLFKILVIVSAIVIKHVMLVNIYTLKIVSAEKKIVNKLVAETVEEVKIAKITLAENENKYKWNSCTVYIVLMIVVFTICTGIGIYFVYYN